jgi:hypothetical protein
MATPDVALAQHIATNVGSLTYGTNIFSGTIRPPDGNVPVDAVFVLASGGVPPSGFLGQTISWKEIELSIFIRSNKDNFASGRDLARQIWPYVQYAQLSGYFDVRARDPDALYLREDSEGRHLHQIAVTATIKE